MGGVTGGAGTGLSTGADWLWGVSVAGTEVTGDFFSAIGEGAEGVSKSPTVALAGGAVGGFLSVESGVGEFSSATRKLLVAAVTGPFSSPPPHPSSVAHTGRLKRLRKHPWNTSERTSFDMTDKSFRGAVKRQHCGRRHRNYVAVEYWIAGAGRYDRRSA
jgi:hypothetical protein